MKTVLFLDAGFNGFSIGLGTQENWYTESVAGYVLEGLEATLEKAFSVMKLSMAQVDEIFMLHGPGSTMSIRTLCAFIRTGIALGIIRKSIVRVADHLHFAEAYRRVVLGKTSEDVLLVARTNLSQCLCLKDHKIVSINYKDCDSLSMPILWLPHPNLPENVAVFSYDIAQIFPLFLQQSLWYLPDHLDLFQL